MVDSVEKQEPGEGDTAADDMSVEPSSSKGEVAVAEMELDRKEPNLGFVKGQPFDISNINILLFVSGFSQYWREWDEQVVACYIFFWMNINKFNLTSITVDFDI